MMRLLLCGSLGLGLGICLQLSGLTRREALASAAALRHWSAIRAMLYLPGLGMMLTALLCYLAVMDVDLLMVPPLHSGMLLGGALFGLACVLCGRTPLTALGAIGGTRTLEGLSCTAGCFLGAALCRFLPVQPLRELFPVLPGTMFRLTLRDPFQFGGGFLALGCLGFLLCVTALLAPTTRVDPALLRLFRLPAPAREDSPEAALPPPPDTVSTPEAPGEDQLFPEAEPSCEDAPPPETVLTPEAPSEVPPFPEAEPSPEDAPLPPDAPASPAQESAPALEAASAKAPSAPRKAAPGRKKHKRRRH